MAEKKDYAGTKNLAPDEPAQVTENGLRLGLPTVRRIEDALKKVALNRPPAPSLERAVRRHEEWEQAIQEHGPNSGQAEKAKRRYLEALGR